MTSERLITFLSGGERKPQDNVILNIRGILERKKECMSHVSDRGTQIKREYKCEEKVYKFCMRLLIIIIISILYLNKCYTDTMKRRDIYVYKLRKFPKNIFFPLKKCLIVLECLIEIVL